MTKLFATLTAAVTALPLAVAAGDASHKSAYDQMTWVPFGEGSPVMISPLWGDMTSGPSGFLLKMPAGFEVPKHTHSANYRVVILSGEALHWDEGEDRASVAPGRAGDYLEQPAGGWHFDANPGTEDVVALVMYDGPVDFIFPEQ